MSPDPARELRDLVAVNAFYTRLVEDQLGHPIPVPEEVAAARAFGPAGQSVLLHWLDLLDMAISPPMVRDALKDVSVRESGEALLRYFVMKRPKAASDRDKADFVATFLYRCFAPGPPKPLELDQPRPMFENDRPGQAQPQPAFENEINRILGDTEVPPLGEASSQLVREFHFIKQEVDDFRRFDELMDSGVIARVRDIKQAFDDSFYHPRVLATLAEYNVFFGARFDELFRHAAQQIKNFAAKVQQEGGSIMARVEGDVTVKQLAEVQENEILHAEYARAQESLRKISKMKKAVDMRGAARPPAPAPPPRPPMAAAAAAPRPAPEVGSETAVIKNLVEDSKTKGVEDSICELARAAAPDWNRTVPVRRGEISLTVPEAEAFRADYGDEKSFRAEYAAALRSIIALQARIMAELEDYRAKRNSAHLWEPHGEALKYLVTCSQRTVNTCAGVLATAQQRGLHDKLSALNTSLDKLRAQAELVSKELQGKS